METIFILPIIIVLVFSKNIIKKTLETIREVTYENNFYLITIYWLHWAVIITLVIMWLIR